MALEEQLKEIEHAVRQRTRLTPEQGVFLYERAPLPLLQELANEVREQRHGKRTYFNRNFHLEPTNLCIYDCKFCAYSRSLKESDDGWFMKPEQILETVRAYDAQPVTEIHIVGGVHPKMNLTFFCEVLRQIKAHRPSLHIKAFTAVELHYMIRKAKHSYRAGLQALRDAGLDSIPGGGAEIFDAEIRAQICPDKCSASEWLEIHKTAHELGIPSNATMLYGHLEQYHHRINHMQQLRDLQDRTAGFNTFIPLKFRHGGNALSHLNEVSGDEDLRNYAVARLFLDNFDHIKAYWPMIGRNMALRSLAFGVDDLDGTIDDSTKIYSMAGSEEQHPSLTTNELVALIRAAEREPIERDTLYRVVNDFSKTTARESVNV